MSLVNQLTKTIPYEMEIEWHIGRTPKSGTEIGAYLAKRGFYIKNIYNLYNEIAMGKEITTLAQLATAINEKRSDELHSNLLTDLIIEKQVKVTTISNGNDVCVLHVFSKNKLCGYIFGFTFENDLTHINRLVVEWGFVEEDSISKMPTEKIVEIPFSYILQYFLK